MVQRDVGTIKEIPTEERPRERLAQYGPQSLSTQELLAIIIRTGSREQSVLRLADALLHAFGGLRGLASAELGDLRRTRGIGPAKAVEISACFELGKRLVACADERNRRELTTPEAVANLLMPEMRDLEVEECRLLTLDTKSRLIRIRQISLGILDQTVIHPREVFRPAISDAACSIILVHNHPTGDPTPSADDHSITRRLRAAGEHIGIELVDHVIIGDNRWVSLRERGGW
ncbi:MAG: DNA repair protein RadC [Chthonomonadales bacterium]|nr:DNA repair protein RadC [Chthonomonadales bacterium]